MTEFFHLYVSGFWPWLGITVGVLGLAQIVVGGFVEIIRISKEKR